MSMSDNELDLRSSLTAAFTEDLVLGPADVPASDEAQQVRLGEPAAEASTGRGLNRHNSSGRIRHDEKITVYVSRDELIALEQARLQLRSDMGLSVDRGRIVRAAVAMALDDLHRNGADSQVVQRLKKK